MCITSMSGRSSYVEDIPNTLYIKNNIKRKYYRIENFIKKQLYKKINKYKMNYIKQKNFI